MNRQCRFCKIIFEHAKHFARQLYGTHRRPAFVNLSNQHLIFLWGRIFQDVPLCAIADGLKYFFRPPQKLSPSIF